MRLEDKIEYRGHFWFLHSPEKKIQGELTIDRDGSLFLSLEFPNWEKRSLIVPRIARRNQNRIHGTIQSGKTFVTLFGCGEHGEARDFHVSMSDMGICTEGYYPSHCIIRPYFGYRQQEEILGKGAKIDFNSVPEVEFDTLRFSFDRLVNFLNVGGFKDCDSEEDDRKIVTGEGVKIEWKKKSEEIPFCDGFTLKAESVRDYNFSPTLSGSERRIGERTIWVLEFPRPLSIEKCIEKVEEIKDFFSFIFGRRVGITHLWGSLKGVDFGQQISEGEVYKKEVWHEIHYQNAHWDPVSPPEQPYVPVTYKDFEDENGVQLFGKYLSSYLEKCASDEFFVDVFDSCLLNLSKVPSRHLFIGTIQDFEYFFRECKIPQDNKRKRIKDLATKLKILIRDAEFSCDEDVAKRIQASDVSSQADYIATIRNNITHAKKRSIDWDILRNDLQPWLSKIASFYLLSMIKEGDLNRQIIEKSRRKPVNLNRIPTHGIDHVFV